MSGGRGIEADMIFITGKVHQRFTQVFETGHSITDAFYRIRGIVTNGFAYFFQAFFNRGRETGYILIRCFGRSCCFHKIKLKSLIFFQVLLHIHQVLQHIFSQQFIHKEVHDIHGKLAASIE